jgi:hypothetical protein
MLNGYENWIDLLQPRSEYFKHPSDLHGPKHTARVMVLAWLLAGKYMPPIAHEMVAAAFLHDLARRHDTTCPEHGRWAVQEFLPQWRKTLVLAGVHDFLMVRYLVANHCLRQHRRPFPLRLFRNADMIDRVTVRPLNPQKMFDCSPELVRTATRLVEADTADLRTLLVIGTQPDRTEYLIWEKNQGAAANPTLADLKPFSR